MATIIYGKSLPPKTSKGRRRLRRLEAARALEEKEGVAAQPYIRSATKAEKIGKREACPRFLLATMTTLSFKPYSGDISQKSEDAMYKVVNHASQRNPKIKW